MKMYWAAYILMIISLLIQNWIIGEQNILIKSQQDQFETQQGHIERLFELNDHLIKRSDRYGDAFDKLMIQKILDGPVWQIYDREAEVDKLLKPKQQWMLGRVIQ